MNSRHDWFQATMPDELKTSPVELLAPLADEPPRLVRGRYNHAHGWQLVREGAPVATVFETPGKASHVLATGSDAEQVASALKSAVEGLRVSRADVCSDFSGGRSFFEDTRMAIRLMAAGKVTTRDYLTTLPDGSKADTLYVGSQKSETVMRLYEKGKESPEDYDPDTIRLEVQVRPSSPARKVYAGTLAPEDFWGFSGWSREMASDLLSIDAPAPPPRSERVSDLERSIDAMALQYGNRMLELLELLDGDVTNFGSTLLSRINRPPEDLGSLRRRIVEMRGR